jgi:hypothetical protein
VQAELTAQEPGSNPWRQRLTGFGWQIGLHRRHVTRRQVGMPAMIKKSP